MGGNAGHGDHDPGAQHKGVKEKDLNLKILLNCKKLHEADGTELLAETMDSVFDLSDCLFRRLAIAADIVSQLFLVNARDALKTSQTKCVGVFLEERRYVVFES